MQFEQAALLATDAEDAYRKQSAAEIGRLAALRLRAYRRVRLIKLLEAAAVTAVADADVLHVQRGRLCQELGWSGESAAQIEVLDQLKDVCLAVQKRTTPAIASETIQVRLEAFENWFLAHRKASFYTLFDQYVQEASVVDF